MTRGSILLVDDETKILNALAAALRDEGHDVVATASAARGAAPARRSALFDVLVVDNLMPELTGLDLIRELVARHARGRAAADPDDDRARHRRERDRGDEARRARLPAEAVRGRRAARRRQPRARAPAAAHAARATCSASATPSSTTTASSAAAGAMQEVIRTAELVARDQEHGAHHRRDRHRQGAGRARDPRPQRAARHAAHQGELRGDPRDAARIGAVRPRARRVHRRDDEQEGQVRARRRRHDLPRRDRHDEPGAAGEAAARAAGARVRAARLGAHARRSTCASSPPPTATCGRWSPTARSRRISTTG